MSFTDYLYNQAQPIWKSNHQHPFLKELAEGILPEEKFAYYMKQDYVYLIEYSRILAYGSIKARDLDTMSMFAKLLDSTLNVEMELHRQFAVKFGVSREELEETKPSPTTLAYTNYLLGAAQSGSLAELTAALLPCMWSYHEIGTSLSRYPGALEHPLYREWITMYASAEFGELAQWCIDLMNQLAEGLPEREHSVLLDKFLTASRMEFLFWDMSYQMEEWPL